MNTPIADVTIIVRECGERTAEACVALLQRLFPGNEIHRVGARPFSATLRLSLEKGLAEGREWTLCIDADVLALAGLLDLLQEAQAAPADVFELQGLVFDKLMAAPRAAGNHLYRTHHLERAVALIPAGKSLRPETQMIEVMAGLGFPWRQSRALVGLHDFEQSYADIYAKAYLHGHKHHYLLPLFRPLWQLLAQDDADFRVANLALGNAARQACPPTVSRSECGGDAAAAVAQLGLTEKPALCEALDAKALNARIMALALRGEARTLGRRIAALTERWLHEHGHFFPAGQASASTSDFRPSIALVCANAYPQFDLCAQDVVGGMEVRAALFGRGLAATDRWRVNFVVGDFDQPFTTRLEDIDFHIYQPVYRKAGRNIFPRLRKRRWFPVVHLDRRDLDLLWQIPLIAAWLALPALFFPRFWRSLNPDVVCCFGNNTLSAEVIADCHRLGIRTILCLASDTDLSTDYQPGNRAANHYGMANWKGHYALSTADRIVVQTESQREALRRDFGRSATLIRNPVNIFSDDPQHWLPRQTREHVLWIGRADSFNKRPMLFVELACACPGLQFVMIASRTDEAVFQMMQATSPPNLSIVEHVAHHETWDYLRRARLFVSTSNFEGFPNTFLQCAVMGVPIVSLDIDPDGMLARHHCGISAAGNVRTLQEAVTSLYSDYPRAEALALACHRYVLERHAAEGRVAEFEEAVASLARSAIRPANIPWWDKLRRFVW